jgi:2-polyprenyl-3-methyl-5-hydroxy-6-metoxy-1,4-benzoquinol methylase/predicted SAM-dependent methyltransferase
MNKEIRKIELGGGEHPVGEGFLNVDARPLPTVDIIADIRDLPFEEGDIEEIFTSNVLEHFNYRNATMILRGAFRVLRPGGKITVIVPDFEKVVDIYKTGNVDFMTMNKWLHGNQHHLYDYHKISWDFKGLKIILSDVGFTKIEKVSYSYGVDYLGCPMLQVIAFKEKQNSEYREKNKKREIIWNKPETIYDEFAGRTDKVGERIVPHTEERLNYMFHLKRYEFAVPYVRDKSVLDVGCGTGYGSFTISSWAKEVFAFDLSKDAIEFASSHYKKDNLRFTSMNWTELENMNKKFDVVVSFEFIEHIEEHDIFFSLVKEKMNENGILIFSTPNKSTSMGINPFHIKEFNPGELKNILLRYFKNCQLYGEFIRPQCKGIMMSETFHSLLRYLKIARIVSFPLRYLRRFLFKGEIPSVFPKDLIKFKKIALPIINMEDILITSSPYDIWSADYLLAVCKMDSQNI